MQMAHSFIECSLFASKQYEGIKTQHLIHVRDRRPYTVHLYPGENFSVAVKKGMGTQHESTFI